MARTREPLKLVLWGVLIVVAVAFVASILGGWLWGWNGYAGYGMMGFGFGWMWLMMLVPLLFVVVLVYALAGNRTMQRASEEPLATAERRYAAGEIPREEFLRLRDDLKGGRQP